MRGRPRCHRNRHRPAYGVIRLPRAPAPAVNAVTGARQQRSVAGLRQFEDVAAIQPLAALLPGPAEVSSHEYAAIRLVIDDPGIERPLMAAVGEQGMYLPLRESGIRRDESRPCILASQNAAPIRREQNVP